MYKVFFNDRKIIISQKTDITLKKIVKIEENLHSKNDVKQWFLNFKDVDEKVVYLITNNTEKFWKNVFIPAFKMIQAAGGVVIRDQQLLFIYRNEKWDLPKGKIDKGETIEEAAIREVNEECGISGHSVVKKLRSTFHIYQSQYKKSKGEWILKETFWFEMNYSGNENGRPETQENITQVRWFEKSGLDEVLANTYENLKQVIEIYLA